MNRKKIKLSDAVCSLQQVIIKKNDGLNNQDIDKEISAWISVYKHGGHTYKNKAKQYLTNILVNSGMIRKKSDLIMDDWSEYEEN